jgi:hypothetical protein
MAEGIVNQGIGDIQRRGNGNERLIRECVVFLLRVT